MMFGSNFFPGPLLSVLNLFLNLNDGDVNKLHVLLLLLLSELIVIHQRARSEIRTKKLASIKNSQIVANYSALSPRLTFQAFRAKQIATYQTNV